MRVIRNEITIIINPIVKIKLSAKKLTEIRLAKNISLFILNYGN